MTEKLAYSIDEQAPRSRGWSLIQLVGTIPYVAAPAQSGMVLGLRVCGPVLHRRPRAAGDDPWEEDFRDSRTAQAPRSRRWSPSQKNSFIHGTTGPAPPGMVPYLTVCLSVYTSAASPAQSGMIR